MNDDEHPRPQLMLKPAESASEQGGGAARLTVFIVAAGLVLSAMGALNHIRPANVSDRTASAQTTPAEVANHAQHEAAPHFGAGLPVIPADWAKTALAQSNYSPQDRASILAALKRRDLSLVQMPIAEIDGKIGDTVRIDAGGFSQIVTLSNTLKVVTLPIHHAGEVTISPVHLIAGNALAAGVMTVYGMYTLPTLSSSELVTLDVIAQ